ncbi:hypothetical protein D1007_58730 [Hordeum vulgare]|nr:hypothetical protein D1007_58730 [Hordeum vulgare]
MVAAGPRLPYLCVGSPESGAAAPLVRHDRLAAVRAVDLASWLLGWRDPVDVGVRRRPVRATWRFLSSPVQRAGQPGGAVLPWVASFVEEALVVAGF